MNRAALVVIDVQESFRQRPIWAYASQPDIVGQVDRLVAAARGRGDLVVWVLHAEPGTGTVFDPALGHVRLIDGLSPVDGEPTLVKTSHNAFTTTNLQQLLTLAGVREVTVCGIRTEQCVETTTRVGADLGYEMTFVTDATVTFPIPHRDLPADASLEQVLADPRTLSTGDIVTRTEYALAGRFATVRTVAELAGAVPAGPAGPVGVADLRRLADHHARGGTVASVCAGAFALGRAGLLDGRRCTTHHEVQDELARRHRAARVVRDVLYVVDDRVVTSAGIASGIDVALHLVATRHGPSAAARIARTLVVYARRNGHEQQASAMMRYRSHLSDAVHRAQDLIDARFSEPLPLPGLAAACGVSERTLSRLFRQATGLTPLGYQQLLRVERAEHLIGHGATVESAARAVGFTDARMLRRLRTRARTTRDALPLAS